VAGAIERSEELVATEAGARQSLDGACHDLDDAVRALAGTCGDDVMASPGLAALLLRVVVARRHLDSVKSGLQPADPARWT